MNYTICIARQFGSLGRPIAQKLAQKLGIEYYDRDIVEAVSAEMHLPVSTISDLEETAGKTTFFNMRFPLGTQTSAKQDMIFDVQKDVILSLAEKKSCIFVGRCSDYILENRPNNLNFYIYAPYKARLENCTGYLKMSLEEVERSIEAVDRARNAYHKRYAGYLPDDCLHKHMLLDSSVLGIDGSAELLAQMVQQRFFS